MAYVIRDKCMAGFLMPVPGQGVLHIHVSASENHFTYYTCLVKIKIFLAKNIGFVQQAMQYPSVLRWPPLAHAQLGINAGPWWDWRGPLQPLKLPSHPAQIAGLHLSSHS
jgi:hypothetical protein